MMRTVLVLVLEEMDEPSTLLAASFDREGLIRRAAEIYPGRDTSPLTAGEAMPVGDWVRVVIEEVGWSGLLTPIGRMPPSVESPGA